MDLINWLIDTFELKLIFVNSSPHVGALYNSVGKSYLKEKNNI